MAAIQRSEIFIFNAKKNNNSLNNEGVEKMNKLEKLKTKENISYRVRADGRIELRFYKENKQYSVYGKNESEVISKYKEWKEPKLKKKKKEKNDKVLTLENWFFEWVDLYKKNTVSQSTYKGYIYTFKKHILNRLGSKKINLVTQKDIQEILNSLNSIPRQKTIVFNNLNTCFKKAKQLKMIKENPCEFVEFKKVKQINKGVALTRTQQKELIEFVTKKNHTLKNIILTCLNTGMRRNELLNLRKKDIDRNKQVIQINGTKTESSIRTLKTTSEIISLIPEAEIPFNFKPAFVSNQFAKIAKELSFENGITFHSLRHTFATRCLESGINIKVIQKWLGHTTLKMTADTYSHIQEEMELNEISKLNNILNFKV